MIKIFIFEKKGQICGWQISGHSGYAEKGSDIVCAAVSIASEMALETLKKSGAKLNYEVKDGYMQVEIFEDLKNQRNVLLAMVEIFEKLQKQYQKFVKMEVKKDVF